MSLARRLLLALPVAGILAGCQHKALEYEPIAAPVLADFSTPALLTVPLASDASDNSVTSDNASATGIEPHQGIPFPVLQPAVNPPRPAQGISLADENGRLSFHPDERLEATHLVITAAGLLSSGPMIARQMQAQLRLDALAGERCAETLSVSARPHSLVFSSRCDGPEALLMRVRSLFEGFGTLNKDNSDRVMRESRLAKHIEAFSGRDIDRLWAQVVLGKAHPYLSLYNDAEAGQQAISAEVGRLASQGRWHLIAARAPESLMSTAEPSFTAVNSGAIEALPERHQNSGKILYLLDAPGQVQSQVRVGYSLPPVGSSTPCKATAALLGRTQAGRLFYDLRSQRGLTYGVYGSCIDNPLSRTLKFYGSSATESTGAFVRGILDHLSLLGSAAPNAAELQALDSYLIGQHKVKADTEGAALGEWLTMLEHARISGGDTGLPEYLPSPLVRAADMGDFPAQYLRSSPWVVIKGDARLLLPDLQQKLPDWVIQRLDKLP
ncbi:insulinase family protein [Shewanella litorisediminis]|uniref:Insulinase family protein n=1 Tax=Shewanella litorisediminis TaxID=1173586 RepID=A0ABX7G5K2_9GAMM|nr:insulinase family protein [Shewanella litorisediminis]MCL2918038.1 insulinase family protein [Shewanella litorisediminis]QRH02468.1 insulinase family protein [Shewanella litorisediminis]